MPAPKESETSLIQKIRAAKPGDEPFQEKLQVSERVIRRVTDGIYREPWAAIRELISNAYDADATSVVVSTDAPRFRSITVRDNGNGFTAESLASMCTNIGGSPKRTALGKNLGVTSVDDPDLSPQGRRLIGKLGIGLFSVSQLTQQFRIVTKVAGSRERTVADVVLFRYAERHGSEQDSLLKGSETEAEITGEVQITKIFAEDVDAHGTDVIIDALLPRTRAEFQSRSMWEMVNTSREPLWSHADHRGPLYHIGVSTEEAGEYTIEANPPWQPDDNPAEKFRKMVDAMYGRAQSPGIDRKPSLSTTFDNYLRFVWLIALSVPIDYLDKHPFDLEGSDGLLFFQLGKIKSGRAEQIVLPQDTSLREKLNLLAPERGGNPTFVVTMDGLELRHPIKYTGLPRTDALVQTPMLFVGSDAPDMSKFSDRVTGGPLRFEGYLLWVPRIVPVEHCGVLVRIGDASGTLFDETFMRYQVSEQKRKEQVMAEIFVHEGMDAALNIDRESFNHSHPHYQYIATWLHDAFKQLATKHKAIGSIQRKTRIKQSLGASEERLRALVESIVENWTDGEEPPISVRYVDSTLFGKQGSNVTGGVFEVQEAVRAHFTPLGERASEKRKAESESNEARMTGVIQILYASGALDYLTDKQQQRLLEDLAKIIFSQAKE